MIQKNNFNMVDSAIKCDQNNNEKTPKSMSQETAQRRSTSGAVEFRGLPHIYGSFRSRAIDHTPNFQDFLMTEDESTSAT
jgi:hypothetical protein